MRRERFLVMGCGGIGGVVAGHLAELDCDVTAVSRNPDVVNAVRDNGLRMCGEGGTRTVDLDIRTTAPRRAQFEWILLATQPQDVEEAAAQAAPLLADDGRVVVFQNGLCEERVAQVLGDGASDRVVGGIVSWGASMVEPGVVDRTSAGGFTLGRFDGGLDPLLARLSTPLQAIGPVKITDNLSGARWSKLALNCNISAIGAIGGDRLGKLVQKRTVRRLALEIMTEVVSVAKALDVRLEKVSGTLDLDWLALTPEERGQAIGSVTLASKHAMLLAVGLRYRRLRSSMLATLERGRRPPIEFLNGEVVQRGEELGVPTPVNTAVCEWLERLAAGRGRPCHDNIQALFDQTRGAVAPLAA